MSTTRATQASNVKTTSKGGTDFVQVEIPKQYFEVLRKWASVGRTVDAAVRLLEEVCPHFELGEPVDKERFVEQANFTIQELETLKQALAACGTACVTAYLEAEAKAKADRPQARLVIGDEPGLYFQTEQEAAFAFGALMGAGINIRKRVEFMDQARFRFGFPIPNKHLRDVVELANGRLLDIFDVVTVQMSDKWWE